ncbi:hypothetical protein ACMBCM_09210, partial [Spiroplasma sp. K1]
MREFSYVRYDSLATRLLEFLSLSLSLSLSRVPSTFLYTRRIGVVGAPPLCLCSLANACGVSLS